MSGKMMCEICSSEFTPEEIGKNHYIAKTTECKLYDAFDCPVCKCQNIVGERKQRSNVIDKGLHDKEDNFCFGIVDKESTECAKCVLSYECKKVKHYGCFTKFDAKNYVCKNVCEYSDLCCELHAEGEKNE